MERRTFIGMLTCELLAVTDELGAQPTSKVYRIGYLTASSKSLGVPLAVITVALRDLGWIEGRTFVLEPRYADNHSDRLAELAAELVQLNVDVIVAASRAAPSACLPNITGHRRRWC